MSGRPCYCARCGAEGELQWVDGHSRLVKPPNLWSDDTYNGLHRVCPKCYEAWRDMREEMLLVHKSFFGPG